MYIPGIKNSQGHCPIWENTYQAFIGGVALICGVKFRMKNFGTWGLHLNLCAVQDDTSIQLSLHETITQVGLKQKNRAFVGQMGM